MLALEFPSIGSLLVWPGILFKDTPFELNKVGIIYIFATVATMTMFTISIRRAALVPRGVQQLTEGSVEFVRESIINQTMGPAGNKFMPFLLSLFFFILFSNLTEVAPFFLLPGNARMAVPFLLAMTVFFVYNAVGIKKQGFFGYIKNSLVPPGVPPALLILVVPIEFVGTFIVRPFSLMVRLFANMLAGHLLLVTFAVLTAALWTKGPLFAIVWAPFVVLIGLTAFEILVAFLQAFIFTILTAVYIGGAMNPEH